MTLKIETQKLIEEQMRQRGFSSADEVVRAAFESFAHQDPMRDTPSDELDALHPGFREAIAEGLADADAGRLSDGDEFFAELEREEQAFDRGEQGRKTG